MQMQGLPVDVVSHVLCKLKHSRLGDTHALLVTRGVCLSMRAGSDIHLGHRAALHLTPQPSTPPAAGIAHMHRQLPGGVTALRVVCSTSRNTDQERCSQYLAALGAGPLSACRSLHVVARQTGERERLPIDLIEQLVAAMPQLECLIVTGASRFCPASQVTPLLQMLADRRPTLAELRLPSLPSASMPSLAQLTQLRSLSIHKHVHVLSSPCETPQEDNYPSHVNDIQDQCEKMCGLLSKSTLGTEKIPMVLKVYL